MTHTDNFDADETETLDGEFEQAGAEEAPGEGEAVALPPRKSGGKFVVILAVLVIGGVVGAAKLGLLPFAIPGLTPAASAPPSKTAGAASEPAKPTPPPASATAVPPMPAPAPAANELSSAALPPPLGAPSGGLTPVTGADAAVPPFGVTAGKPEAAPAGDKTTDNSAFMPQGITHAGGPASIAPPAGSMMPPPLATAAPYGIKSPDAKAPAAKPVPDNNAAGLPGVPSMPAVTPAPVSADALGMPPQTMTPAASAAESEKVHKLEERIATLEKTIADLKAGMASKSDINDLRASLNHMSAMHASDAPAVTPAPDAAAGMPDVAAPKTSKLVARHTTTRRHHASSRSSATTATEAAASMPKSVTTVRQWVLKAATPNSAWVAAPGSSEIKAVSVGDTLPGVGRITSVSKDSGGRWVVLGTRGKINQ